jgi:hypothetical protein
LAALGFSLPASAGCLLAQPTICSPTINADGQVGLTSYATIPFAGSVYGQSWASSPGLTPRNLFWQYGTNFTNAATMAAARQSASSMTAQGIVPASGAQRWEDTYEAAQPASLFPGEPSWINNDRVSLNLLNQRDYQAWVGWEKAHANLFIAAADGGSEGLELRPWLGEWGHISPMMPLPSQDWPTGMTNATYGDWFAYRWGQTAHLSGAYGIMLSDFSDSQPTWPSWAQGFNKEIVAGFQSFVGQTVQGSGPATWSTYINANLAPSWNDYLAAGYGQFFKALAARLHGDTGQQSLVIDQCGLWSAARRFYGIDQRTIAKTMPAKNYICIWDDQTMQVGRSGESMIWGIGGMVIAAAREPNLRNGANLSANDSAFWQAAATFWSNLSVADQQERGLKELKRAWLETAWSHIATRQGTVRRALSFLSRDYWDSGQVDATVQHLIQTVVPTRPFGYALYYSTYAERQVEAKVPASKNLNGSYMNPDELLNFKQGGGAVAYYVSDAGIARLQNSARPAAWIVLDQSPPATELAKLRAIPPVLTSLSDAQNFAGAPLAFSAGLTGTGFFDQNSRLMLTVSNPSASGIDGTITLRSLPDGAYVATDQFTGAQINVTVSVGTASVAVTVSRWDTRVFALTSA